MEVVLELCTQLISTIHSLALHKFSIRVNWNKIFYYAIVKPVYLRMCFVEFGCLYTMYYKKPALNSNERAICLYTKVYSYFVGKKYYLRSLNSKRMGHRGYIKPFNNLSNLSRKRKYREKNFQLTPLFCLHSTEENFYAALQEYRQAKYCFYFRRSFIQRKV